MIDPVTGRNHHQGKIILVTNHTVAHANTAYVVPEPLQYTMLPMSANMMVPRATSIVLNMDTHPPPHASAIAYHSFNPTTTMATACIAAPSSAFSTCGPATVSVPNQGPTTERRMDMPPPSSRVISTDEDLKVWVWHQTGRKDEPAMTTTRRRGVPPVTIYNANAMPAAIAPPVVRPSAIVLPVSRPIATHVAPKKRIIEREKRIEEESCSIPEKNIDRRNA